MTVRFVRPVSSSAQAARRLALGALMLLAIAVVAHRFGPLATPHFLALTLLSAAIAVLSLPLALHGLMQLWRVGAEGGVASAKALIFALPPIGLALFGLWLYQTHPPLYDVTTDPDDPPEWRSQPQANQLWLSRPTFVTPVDRRLQRAAYPGLTGRRYEGALDRVYEAVMVVAKENSIALAAERGFAKEKEEAADEAAEADKARGRDVPDDAAPPIPDVIPVPLPRPGAAAAPPVPVPQAQGDLLLQGATRTLILGLPFDVAVRLREEEETTLVDIRVAARYGAHDLGIGADIAEDFLRALDAELLGIVAQ